jgi:hypothetical protein
MLDIFAGVLKESNLIIVGNIILINILLYTFRAINSGGEKFCFN